MPMIVGIVLVCVKFFPWDYNLDLSCNLYVASSSVTRISYIHIICSVCHFPIHIYSQKGEACLMDSTAPSATPLKVLETLPAASLILESTAVTTESVVALTV